MISKISTKLRVIFWFVEKFLRKYFLIVFISFFISVMLFLLGKSIYPSIAPYITVRKERIAIIGKYTPSTLPLSIQSLISSGLTSITLEGSPSAALATSWTVSEDGKTYTFVLRKDVKWHDGKIFTASDVNYNLKNAIIIPKETDEITVYLNEPYIPLPVILSKPLFKKGLIGVGPYKVKSIKLKGDTLEYLELVPLSPSLPRKIYRFYQTEEKVITAFKLGEVDIIEEITEPTKIANWNNVVTSEKVLLNRFVGLFFNTKNEYFKDREIRQTLSLASPAFYGKKPLSSISPLSWAYYPKVKEFDQDLELAKKKLVSTPFSTSSAEITISTFENLLSFADKIVEDWQSIGINAQVKLESTIPSDFQILLATQEIPPDPDQYPLWHSTQSSTNLTKLTNPKIDKLLEDGRTTSDSDERLKIYIDFQRYLAEETPVALLYYPRVYTVRRK